MASRFLRSTLFRRSLRSFATSSTASSAAGAISTIPSTLTDRKPIHAPPSPPSVDTNLSSFSSSSYALDLTDSTATGISAIPSLTVITPPPTSDCILDLKDHRKLFSSVPTKKLIHASLILQLAAIDSVVDLGIWIMRSKLMQESDGVIRQGILRLIRHTFYEHFVAGEDTDEVKKYVERLNQSGLRGMLDYAVEFTTKNDGCDLNFQAFSDTIDAAKSYPPDSVRFSILIFLFCFFS